MIKQLAIGIKNGTINTISLALSTNYKLKRLHNIMQDKYNEYEKSRQRFELAYNKYRYKQYKKMRKQIDD